MSHYSNGVWFSWAKAARPRHNLSLSLRSTWKLSDTCRRWTLLKVSYNPWVSAVHPQKDNIMKSCGILKYELIIGLISVFWQIWISPSVQSCVVCLTVLVTGFMAGYTAIWELGWCESFHLVWGGRVGWVQTNGFIRVVSYRIVAFLLLGGLTGWCRMGRTTPYSPKASSVKHVLLLCEMGWCCRRGLKSCQP